MHDCQGKLLTCAVSPDLLSRSNIQDGNVAQSVSHHTAAAATSDSWVRSVTQHIKVPSIITTPLLQHTQSANSWRLCHMLCTTARVHSKHSRIADSSIPIHNKQWQTAYRATRPCCSRTTTQSQRAGISTDIHMSQVPGEIRAKGVKAGLSSRNGPDHLSWLQKQASDQ